MRTPNDIEVLLHCHTSPEPHPRLHAPAVREAIEMWLALGYVKPRKIEGMCIVDLAPTEKHSPEIYGTTPFGAAMVKAICKIELPKQVFVDSNGNIL